MREYILNIVDLVTRRNKIFYNLCNFVDILNYQTFEIGQDSAEERVVGMIAHDFLNIDTALRN